MFKKRNRGALALIDERHVSPARIIAGALWRWRRQLAPFTVALLALGGGWTAALLRLLAGNGWLLAAYGVGTLCAVAWLTRLSGYNRALGATVTTAALVWSLLVAYQPLTTELYGVWALGTPVLGLGWWMSATLRAQLRADRVQKRWKNIAALAGIAGARLLGTRATPAGEVLSVKLAAGQTATDVSRSKLESAYELPPGAVKVEEDKTNSRMVQLHLTETNPWEGPLNYPALGLLHTNN